MTEVGKRANRGKRINQLLDEEADADDEFWQQDFFKEEAEDQEYESEKEEVDVIDSDFYESVRPPSQAS